MGENLQSFGEECVVGCRGICKILRSMTDALCVDCSRRSALKSAVLCSPLWHVLVHSSVETLRNCLERKPGRIIFSLAAPCARDVSSDPLRPFETS